VFNLIIRRVSFLFTVAIAALLFCFPDSVSAASRKPNVLLILADDLGHEVINSYGGTSYKTPNIDALGRSGVRFTSCYATPLCSPSRVELMTGRYGFRTSWINLIGRGAAEEVNDYFDPKKETTFGRVLKDAGYATAIAGKWQLCEFQKHSNHLAECGFDESLCWAWLIDAKQTSRYWAPVLWDNGKMRKLPADAYGDDLFSDFLIDFMKRHKEKPFFAYYPMALVHAPHIAPPGSPRAAAAQKAAGGGKGGGAKKKQKAAADDDTVVNDPKNFPDMVAYMDKTVAKLMRALDELGLRENTLVIFTGDNGTDRKLSSMMGDVRIPGGKGTVTELGSHVPLFAVWPGTITAGTTNTTLVNFCDVLPTLAEVTGTKPPAGVRLDGQSFAPQLTGKPGKPREWVFTQLGKKRFARDQRFLLHDDGRMYDIPNDLFEKNDLSASKEPEIAAAKQRLTAVLEQCK
jgi:arylsulfatase A